MSFGQFASTSQFYLYGKKYCTKTGWEAASNAYPIPDLLSDVDLSGNVYIVTGANAGIGFGITSFLVARHATVYMVCRSAERGRDKRDRLVEEFGSGTVHLLQCDCGLERDVRRMWSEFVSHCTSTYGAAKLNALICNAGALTNEKVVTDEGVESTLATHLIFGTYLLTTLALPVLENTPGARVVVVSSGGMYNTKFPEWSVASGSKGKYNGQLAYAYAKRGQVLLCERWTAMYPKLKFVSCHPGWVDTPGVDSAYGESKRYLAPLRSIWEGSEGIVWLAIAPISEIRSGEFYLDRSPCRKHIAGPFFTDGSFTKNSAAEVDTMMKMLQQWSDSNSRPAALEPGSTDEPQHVTPLEAMSRPIDIKQYMGRWYVLGEIRSFITKGSVNNVEDYVWDEANKEILVSFKYAFLDENGKVGQSSELKQRATIVNESNTEWALSVKLLIYIPISLRYLVLDVDESYSCCLVGVADRSMLWIMCRTPNGSALADAAFDRMISKAADLGYDINKVERVPHIQPTLSDEVMPQTDENRAAVIEEIFQSFESSEARSACLEKLTRLSGK